MKRVFLICLFMVTLAGCSSTTFLYNRLDFILPWLLGDYVRLDSAQKVYLKQQLDPFLDWHREEELPRYIDLIEQIERTLDDPVTVTQVEAIVAEFERAWARVERRGVGLLLDLGERLDDEQMAEFLDALFEKQQELQEKYLERSDEEYYKDAYDNFTDSAQDFLGRLSSEQKLAIEQGIAGLWRSDHAWISERAAWNERLSSILQREPGWQDALWAALARREQDISPEYRETYLHNSAHLQGVLVNLLNSRTEAQDRRLRRELADYREDFARLVEQSRD